jgi:hypothetical protein
MGGSGLDDPSRSAELSNVLGSLQSGSVQQRSLEYSPQDPDDAAGLIVSTQTPHDPPRVIPAGVRRKSSQTRPPFPFRPLLKNTPQAHRGATPRASGAANIAHRTPDEA